MAVVSTDIKLYLSGGGVGAGNTSPANSLGGVITSTQWTDSIFDNVGSGEAAVGESEYRCVFVKNTNATDTLYNAVIWIYSNTPSTDTAITIAPCDEGANATVELIPDEDTAPTGPTFVTAVDEANAVALGNLGPNEYYGVWIKRTVSASASSYANDTFTLRVKGDTAGA